MATLKQIGAELGLSPATVSRALNGFPEVNAETRARVRAVADRLGYRPNRIAQRLVTGRSGMVGMILKIRPDMSADQTFFEMLTGLTAALAVHDVDLVLAVDQGDDPVAPYAKMMERNILDGFILHLPLVDDQRVAFLASQKIPFVMHGRSEAEADYAFYDIDNEAVSGLAVAHLAALGHQRIVLVNGDPAQAFAQARSKGFSKAMGAQGLSLSDDQICHTPMTKASGYTEALKLLSAQDSIRPTALICSSTLVAAGVLQAATELNLSVPQDLSVVAHDDDFPTLDASRMSPPLTVTRAPLDQACQPLADLLVSQIRTGKTGQVTTEVEFINRASTGPVG